MSKLNDHRLISNPDLRRQMQFASPPVEEIERRLKELITPDILACQRRAGRQKGLRERILSLPAMAAIVLSLVYRRLPSLQEALRILHNEGLLWVEPTRVSRQALDKRFEKMPASLFAGLFQQVVLRISQGASAPQSLMLAPQDQGVLETFSAVWIADGSTLEALRKHLDSLKQASVPLGGKILLLVQAFGHQPLAVFYTEDAKADDRSFGEAVRERLPKNGLLLMDAGWLAFDLYDAFTKSGRFFVSRPRTNTAYKRVRLLSEGPRFRDEIVQLGQYRSNPCQYPVRLISVLWKGVWYRYLTNVLDPQKLSACQVCQLYRRRWRIEDAFLLTKRLLGLAYLWVGSHNGVELQVYATLILYAILTDVCWQVSLQLGLPLERISAEMVFRSLYHFRRACEMNKASDWVCYLRENAGILGIVKAVRKRHRQIAQENQLIWEGALS